MKVYTTIDITDEDFHRVWRWTQEMAESQGPISIDHYRKQAQIAFEQVMKEAFNLGRNSAI